ncbi:MAG: hypothetical protein QF412_14390 [Planctomycetota bacterium]|jgi:hypothetical protein|nr:hypothetical protein [Planctomycetota bacterium]
MANLATLFLAGIPALLVQGLSAQVVTKTPALIVSGVLEQGQLPPSSLGLGGGGLGSRRFADRNEPGRWVSPGGILVRARKEGVKIDFPSGAELLVTPSARICLRGGEQTLPCLSGIQISFTDGSRLRAWRSQNGQGPLSRVEADDHSNAQLIWSGQKRSFSVARSQQTTGESYLALGDGSALYRALPLGPLVMLERVLCSHDSQADYPEYRMVVCGDILADSLMKLERLVPRRMVQFPQAREIAMEMGRLAPILFRRGAILRPPGSVGELAFPLTDDFHLLVSELPEKGPLTIGLFRRNARAPLVEWIVGPPTRLHLVRPDGGEDGGPRYFLRGIDLAKQVEGMMSKRPTAHELQRARKILRSLNGR